MDFQIAVEKHLQILSRKNFSKSYGTHRRRYLKYFGVFLERRSITDIRSVGSKDILDFEQFVHTKPQWAAQTSYDILASVQNFFKRLFHADLLLFNPAKVLDLHRPPPRLHQVLSLSEMEQLLNAPFASYPAGLRDKAIIELLYSGGMRLSELRHLKIQDVDFKERLVFIHQGKGYKDRVVPLGYHAAQAIQDYLKIRPQFLKTKTELLFLNKFGQLMDINMVGGILNRYAQRCGLKKRLYPHLLRHTMATHFLAAGASVSIVQHVLGHATPKVTQIYTQVRPCELKAVYGRCHPLTKGNRFIKLYEKEIKHNSWGKV